ncbi:MAG TPA: FliM/FliN family flagellar motor switch protein [Solirubrobacteraceae bacterium]|nr:FliM/FliN family flagellar motor switch protein [Solirubrobacteraceae bacterium]
MSASVAAGGIAERRGDDQAPAEQIHSLDFSQPTKFNPELRRRIALVLGPFLKSAAMRLSGELKATVELHQIDAREVAWSAARGSLPEDAALAEIKVRPIGAQMLLAAELPLLLRGIECLLGGSAASAPTERRLSEIDLALIERLLETTVAQLSLAWRDLGGLELELGEVDVEHEHDAGVEVHMREPTYLIAINFLIAELPSRLFILVPWAAIDPVTASILEQGSKPDANPRHALALRRGLASVRVLLHAEVGACRMPVARLSALRAGEVLRLQAKADQGVRLLADRVALAYGTPGRSGSYKALKLSGPVAPAPGPALLPPPSLRGARSEASSERTPPAVLLERIAALRGADLRVWAELGRVELSLQTVLSLPPGAVIELDAAAEDPVAIYANGMRLASGSLFVTDEGEWAVRLGDPGS